MDKWTQRFLQLAQLVASWSKDPSTKCGAVIVRQDNTIVSTGFNGFASKMLDAQEFYDTREEKLSRIIHAETNCILHAKESLHGYRLYTYPLAPCDRCCVMAIQAGIDFFTFPVLPPNKVERWGVAIEKTKQYLQECNIKWNEVNIDWSLYDYSCNHS